MSEGVRMKLNPKTSYIMRSGTKQTIIFASQYPISSVFYSRYVPLLSLSVALYQIAGLTMPYTLFMYLIFLYTREVHQRNLQSFNYRRSVLGAEWVLLKRGKGWFWSSSSFLFLIKLIYHFNTNKIFYPSLFYYRNT